MAFLNAIDAERYALAGRAVLTMQSERTGAHYTFLIERGKKGDAHFVKLLVGPDNGGDYAYLGMIKDRQFSVTRGSKFAADSLPAVSFKWIWGHLAERGNMPPQCVIRHEGECGRCGRALTTPRSIDLGIGPECAKKMGLASEPRRRKDAAAGSATVVPFRSAVAAGPDWMMA